MRDTDQVVLATVSKHLLRADVIEAALARAVKGINANDLEREKKSLETRRRQVEKELRNLSQAVAAGTGKLETLTAAIQEREAERERLRQDTGRD